VAAAVLIAGVFIGLKHAAHTREVAEDEKRMSQFRYVDVYSKPYIDPSARELIHASMDRSPSAVLMDLPMPTIDEVDEC
jgi:hypothetical protein